MSITISSLFIVFLLCLPMHASHAPKVPKEYISSKVGQKAKLGVGSIHQGAGTDEASKGSGSPIDAISSKPKEPNVLQDEIKRKGETKSGVIPIKSVGSVSWHVPPKKKQAKNPGFYSDYSRPRTRPPCHN